MQYGNRTMPQTRASSIYAVRLRGRVRTRDLHRVGASPKRYAFAMLSFAFWVGRGFDTSRTRVWNLTHQDCDTSQFAFAYRIVIQHEDDASARRLSTRRHALLFSMANVQSAMHGVAFRFSQQARKRYDALCLKEMRGIPARVWSWLG